MLRVALTGGIATGKSHVRRRFEALGVDTIDADALVHQALAAGTPTAAHVAARFGQVMLAPDGSVHRGRLGALVFRDVVARHDLEEILHPPVYAAIRDWCDDRERAGARLAVADIPLLYETGHDGEFDRVVVAACPLAEQVRRVVARDGLAPEAAADRVAAQLPIDDKVRRADHVIWTTGTLEETDRSVDRVYEDLKQRATGTGH